MTDAMGMVVCYLDCTHTINPFYFISLENGVLLWVTGNVIWVCCTVAHFLPHPCR